jgi:hypothetical protein
MHARLPAVFLFLTLGVLLALAGCAAPATQAPQAGPVPSPPAASPAPPSTAQVSRSCKVDADCAVKDVGSCCGYFPACVSKDAKPDPAAVRAQCATQGVAGVCGFREVSGCSCVQGTCRDAGSGGAQVR